MKKQLYRTLEELKSHYNATQNLTEQVLRNRQLFPESFVETMLVGLTEYAFILKDFEEILPPRTNGKAFVRK